MRIAIMGNAGSGKSTLALRLKTELNLPLHEVDTFQWTADWSAASSQEYEAAHQNILRQEAWILDGMGQPATLPERLDRATHVIFCDFPIWQNFWLMAERQAAWHAGDLKIRPGGQRTPPNTKDLFRVVWNIHETFMPQVRKMIDNAEKNTSIHRISTFEDMLEFEFHP